MHSRVKSIAVAGDSLYFVQYERDTDSDIIVRLGPDLILEPLEFTLLEDSVNGISQLAVARDGHLAWSTQKSEVPQPGGNETWTLSVLLAMPEQGETVTTLVEIKNTELLGPFLNPVRFSADGASLYFTLAPFGLGGMWTGFHGSYQNLYRVPTAGGEAELLYECDLKVLLCIGDFRDDGTFSYVDENRFVHVVGADGGKLAEIPTDGDYVGYAVFNSAGDLFYNVAVVAEEPDGPPVRKPGMIYTVPMPYTDAPTLLASADGLSIRAYERFNGILDEEQLIVHFNPDGGEGVLAILKTTGEIIPIDPPVNGPFLELWPAAEE